MRDAYVPGRQFIYFQTGRPPNPLVFLPEI